MNKKEQSGSYTVFKMIGNIISWTLLVLLLIVAGFLMYYIISTQLYAAKGEKYAPKYSLYTIISPSMTPNINVYDIIIDKRVDDPSKLEVGDVITFISTSSISNGMTITHRIVDKIDTEEGIKYKTKGDNNLTADYALVTQDKIIGKVQFRIPQLGRIQFFLSSKGGWLFVILIPALIIIFGDILKLTKLVNIKKRVKDVEQKDEEEEYTSQEQLIQEHKKQEELKKKLQQKNNRIKYKRSEFEPDGFLLEHDTLHITVNADGSTTVNKDNKVLVSNIEDITFKEKNELYDDSMIIKDTNKEYINESNENNNGNVIFKDFLNNVKEKTEVEVLEVKNSNNLEQLKSMFEEEEEEIELPKLIQIRDEEIPDDLDLPSLSDENKE